MKRSKVSVKSAIFILVILMGSIFAVLQFSGDDSVGQAASNGRGNINPNINPNSRTETINQPETDKNDAQKATANRRG